MKISSVMRIWHSDSWRVALVCETGRKFTSVIVPDASGLKLSKMPNSDARHWRQEQFRGAPYPLDRAKRKFRKAGKEFGMSKRIKQLLA